mmetsp:Transcript_4703/g.11846  ORF Transcript_4703/g.11846 Transcript_4703/m.11846 type:complete len:212 (+) Transcript_4703:363-998(+)
MKHQSQRWHHQQHVAHRAPPLLPVDHPRPHVPRGHKPSREKARLVGEPIHIQQAPRIPLPHHHRLPRVQRQHLTLSGDLHMVLLQNARGTLVALTESLYQLSEPASEFATVSVVVLHVALATDPLASPVSVAASQPHVRTRRLVSLEHADGELCATSLVGTCNGVRTVGDFLPQIDVGHHASRTEERPAVRTFRRVGRIRGLRGSVVDRLP